MLSSLAWDWSIDGWIILTGILCAVSASLLGNFLVLRRMSMLGDAISHAVLPGLVAAFFISHNPQSLTMFVGAALVGALTALFTDWIRKAGQVDEGASIGVVFTSLFALGLLMIHWVADRVDLDPNCVLFGSIEMTPFDQLTILGAEVPKTVVVLSVVSLLNCGFIVVFYKELKISSFDPASATAGGFNATLIHYVHMILVAVTAVAAFESVGSILVVAMFIVPPAAAYLLTDRLAYMIILSVLLASVSAVLGHIGAISVPGWFGFRSTTTAGMMALSAGLVFFLAAMFSPKHGYVVKVWQRRLLNWQILSDDLVALLYRIQAGDRVIAPRIRELAKLLLSDTYSLWLVSNWLRWKGQVIIETGHLRLTEDGVSKARKLVRSHRLWEQYLAAFASLDTERIHDKAEQLEHFTNRELRDQLASATDLPDVDPHGSLIPPEEE